MEGVRLDAPGDSAGADFGAFFDGRYRELGALAYRLSGEREVAEEVTADAFAEAWRRWDEVSSSDSPAAVMQEILARYAQGRVRRAEPDGPQDPYEPDASHIRALMAERIALIPQQRSMTVVLAGAGADDGGRRATSGLARFRRPGPIGIVIAVNTVAAIVAIVVTTTTSGSSAGHGKSATVSLTDTSTVDGFGGSSPDQAAAATSPAPSRSASASASPSPTADQSTNSAPSSAAVTTEAAVVESPSASISATADNATTAASADLLTATGTVNVNSNASWTELDVKTNTLKTLSAMTITINVAHCAGLSTADDWNDGAGGQFSEPTPTTNANGSITYQFILTSGDEVSPGDLTFAAQFSHDTSGWSAGADTYSVTATQASTGATEELGGSF